MIILDTNVVSELMRPQPNPGVVAWADRQAEVGLFLTTITLAELRFGIAALPSGQRRTALAATLEDQIRPMFGNRVLDFDEPASASYADLRAAARRHGQAIGDVDAMIAAIAKRARFGIATRDVTPFEAVGLTVIDPFVERDDDPSE